ncbi:MAG: hypothetical protein ACUVRV_00985 [Cyanobacteriota bacterium]
MHTSFMYTRGAEHHDLAVEFTDEFIDEFTEEFTELAGPFPGWSHHCPDCPYS